MELPSNEPDAVASDKDNSTTKYNVYRIESWSARDDGRGMDKTENTEAGHKVDTNLRGNGGGESRITVPAVELVLARPGWGDLHPVGIVRLAGEGNDTHKDEHLKEYGDCSKVEAALNGQRLDLHD